MIPDYVSKFNTEDQRTWSSVYKIARQKHTPEKSVVVANKWYLEATKERERKSISRIGFKLMESDKGEIIQRDLQGDLYFDAVLGSENPHKDELKYSPGLLNRWADQINSGDYSGDIDHAWLNKMMEKYGDIDQVVRMVKNKPGITKKVKAWFQDGMLKIRGWIDKRYKSVLQKVKGLSLEAIIRRSKTNENEVEDGDFMGWTFSTDDEMTADSYAKITGWGETI